MLSKQTVIKTFDLVKNKKVIFRKNDKFSDKNIVGIFIDGPKYEGKLTKIFAYLGIPKEKKNSYPAVILAHGGGGTAYKEWVKKWTDNGYIAIAPDLEGHIPIALENAPVNGQFWESHEYSGPYRTGAFDDMNKIFFDQWIFHSVGALIKSCTLLNQMDIVDSNRVGICGISWGSILSILTSSLDTRIKFASLTYGCGFLFESKGIFGTFFDNSNKKFWDPANFLSNINIPMLWINGDSDYHFSLDIFCKTYGLVEKNSLLTIYPSMLHSHEHGWQPVEINSFVDSVCRGTEPLIKLEVCGKTNFSDSEAGFSFKADFPEKIKKVTIVYIKTEIKYDEKRKPINQWEVTDVNFFVTGEIISVKIPPQALTFYVNVKDRNNRITSLPVQK